MISRCAVRLAINQFKRWVSSPKNLLSVERSAGKSARSSSTGADQTNTAAFVSQTSNPDLLPDTFKRDVGDAEKLVWFSLINQTSRRMGIGDAF